MDNLISFYHFNTKDAMDTTSLKDTDIAFCKETRSIRTHGMDYLTFEWDEIPDRKIGDWIKDHMVFYYDMSKPMDYYEQNFTQWIKYNVNADVEITNSTITITKFTTANDVVGCYIPGGTEFSGINIKVEGITNGQWIYWGYSADKVLVKITSDGSYYLPYTETTLGNLSFRNGNISGSCNITITQMTFIKDIPDNEMLKINRYLEDLSGNNRPLKLNNFLFAGMSGVGGYSLNPKSYHSRSGNVMESYVDDYFVVVNSKLNNNLGIVWTENGVGDSNSVAVGETLTRPEFTVTVTGMPDDLKWGLYEGSDTVNKGNGTFKIPAYTYTNNTETVQTKFIGITFNKSTFDDVNIIFTFQPLYPNALVTDGVDDYGLVQNLSHGVKMLFMTCNPFNTNKFLYDQRINNNQPYGRFAIYNYSESIAYSERNLGGDTYIDGVLNSSTKCSDLLNKKQTITIVNSEVDIENETTTPVFFNIYSKGSFNASLAFYNSIGFDAVPDEVNDGVGLQEVISYVNKYILNS